MPRRDQTGPQGEGPKTGRGLGDCEPKTQSSDQTTISKGGFGAGQGGQARGRGRGRCFDRGRSRG